LIAALAVTVLLAQEAPIAGVELALEVVPPEGAIEFGVPFELSVVQTWQRTFEVEEWGVEKLDPLVAELVEETRRENPTHVEETRRFTCYAFALDEVVLPALFLRARSSADGTQRLALGDELRLVVGSGLPLEDTGVMELPRDLFPAPFPWALVLATLALLSSSGFVVHRIRSGRTRVESEVPPEPAHLVARRRIALLRDRSLETREEVRAFHVEISSILRTYLEGRFEVEPTGKTTDEFFADPATERALEPEVRASLRALLARSDLVKYAGQASGAEERESLLVTIETFVEETCIAEGGDDPGAEAVA